MLSIPRSIWRFDLIIACSLAALAALLVFPNLGQQALWQDEGQTAVVAQNVLRTGQPLASDGRNLVSIFPDHRDIREGIYIWQPFVPVYAAAASMAIGGESAAAARLPFASAFVLLIGLSYWIVHRWNRQRQVALLTALFMVTSVVLLLHARQCRYYVLAPLLNLLIVHSYLLLRVKARVSVLIGLVIWFTLLINTFFPGAFVLALALAVDCVIRTPHQAARKHLLIAAASVAVINLPIAISLQMWSRQFGVQPGYTSFTVFFAYLLRYVSTVNLYFFPLLLLIPVALHALVKRKTIRLEDHGLAGCSLAICLSHVVVFAALSDYPFSRYLIGMAPFLFYLGALSVQRVTAGRATVLWPLTAALIFTNWIGVLFTLPLRGLVEDVQWSTAGIDGRFLRQGNVGVSLARGETATIWRESFGSPLLAYGKSVLHTPRGPVDHLLEVLNAEARPSDVVKIAYEDLPLMFHTHLNIVSATDIGPAAPDWIIERHLSTLLIDPGFVEGTRTVQYQSRTLDVADVQWNNQPDPLYHFFEDPPSRLAPHLTILKKVSPR